MLAAAGAATKLLGDAAAQVRQFVHSRLRPDGGFCGRSEDSDLYYTVFGLEALSAVGGDVPGERVAAYLRTFGDARRLDFVHLACWVRCWADLPDEPEEGVRRGILNRLESFRAADGGYAPTAGSASGTAYGCFLGLSAYQDLGVPMPDAERMVGCVESLRAEDGGYANQAGSPVGLTPATAAAVCVLRELDQGVDAPAGEWLLSRCGEAGGFVAVDGAPLPDLLSTATALHALARIGAPLDSIHGRCLEFVRSLRTEGGGFRGHGADDQPDCEYTYYGLLALGHLALCQG